MRGLRVSARPRERERERERESNCTDDFASIGGSVGP
jgi:hypothetical protein